VPVLLAKISKRIESFDDLLLSFNETADASARSVALVSDWLMSSMSETMNLMQCLAH
jgi:hypothetical protein